jgi:hypothetical protein
MDLFIRAKMTTPLKGETNKIIMKDRGLPVHKNYSYSGFQQYSTLKNNHYCIGNKYIAQVINIGETVNKMEMDHCIFSGLT